MSLPSTNTPRTPARGRVTYAPDTGGLDDTPAGATDRDALLEHLGRKAIHASKDRNFKTAYFATEDGTNKPRLYRVTSKAFTECQYAMLVHKQYASVIVVDIDQRGTRGGHPINLNRYVRGVFATLVSHNIGPAWVGINPESGKAQAIWLIDPVYADKDGQSRHMKLLEVTTRTLGELLDHDPRFSHRFSRSPFYEGNDPTAYRWYPQHKHVMRLADLLKEVRDLAGLEAFEAPERPQFTSGRDLINAVKARREEAQAFKAITADTDREVTSRVEEYDSELINGVRVLWISPGEAARDETAFRHALKTAIRLRAAGERMTDAAIIDAYEHAYTTAQRLGANGRDSEMPSMRERQSMARRVRGYAMNAKDWKTSGTSLKSVTQAERKALATMGRKGGKKAAERWKTDPDGEYAQAQRQTLAEANKQRQLQGNETRAQVYAVYTATLAQTGKAPTGAAIGRELSITRKTASAHLRVLREAGLIA